MREETQQNRTEHTNSSPEPILRLGEHKRARGIEHLIGDLLGVAGQAVHELPAGTGAAALREVAGDLEPLEVTEALLSLLLLAHRDPGIRDDDVGVGDGLLGGEVLRQLPPTTTTTSAPRSGLTPDQRRYVLRDPVPVRRGDGDVRAQLHGPDGQVEEHVVGVADPGDLQVRREDTKARAGARRREGLVDREEVRDYLQRVEVVAQRVDDGHAGVLG